ncbi:hypothetical protein V1512DRAFT_263596 [Lipomyces arxii]|uniref:uncharacterized protein n=1 Tax=Lipomyces arxii TaxID=56418 RepID=UPI0034CF22E6
MAARKQILSASSMKARLDHFEIGIRCARWRTDSWTRNQFPKQAHRTQITTRAFTSPNTQYKRSTDNCSNGHTILAAQFRSFAELRPRYSLRRFSQNQLKDAIAEFSMEHHKERTRFRRQIIIGGVVLSIASYMAYKLYIQNQTMFIPYWLKPYVFEEILTSDQLASLHDLTVEALLEAIAYQNSVAAIVGLPIMVESMQDVHFAFPEGRPAEHVLKGFEIYRDQSSQFFPSIRRSVRIFSPKEISSGLISPLFEAVGLFNDNVEEPVHEMIDNVTLKPELWVEVTGSASIEGARTRRLAKENASQDSSLPKTHCTVKFKGYMDLDRMNTVRIQTGELVLKRGDEELKRLSW